MEATNDFVITWSGMGPGDSRGVFVRRFDAWGNPLGSEELVNTFTLYDQQDASVSVAPSGTFVVTWTSWYQDGSGRGVYGQEYDNFGAKLGGEFLVSNTTFTDQRFSSVATKGDSGFVVAWSGRGTGDTTGVFVRSYSRPAPLMASEGENAPGLADALTSIELDGIRGAALGRFEDAGATAEQLALLANVDVQIVDLSPGVLGTSYGHTIQIDLNAAGWGWFVDATPWDDNEFTLPANDSPAAGKVDLLSVVLHEMSHVLGYGHTDHGVLAETLGRGIRQADLDALFADLETLSDVCGS